jgi:hypothetical protein
MRRCLCFKKYYTSLTRVFYDWNSAASITIEHATINLRFVVTFSLIFPNQSILFNRSQLSIQSPRFDRSIASGPFDERLEKARRRSMSVAGFRGVNHSRPPKRGYFPDRGVNPFSLTRPLARGARGIGREERERFQQS